MLRGEKPELPEWAKQREIEKVILNMHKKGYSLEQIMDATELEEIELKSMIKKLK